MVDHENLVNFSCFRTFSSPIFAFILNAFFFTCFCPFFSFADINKDGIYREKSWQQQLTPVVF